MISECLSECRVISKRVLGRLERGKREGKVDERRREERGEEEGAC